VRGLRDARRGSGPSDLSFTQLGVLAAAGAANSLIYLDQTAVTVALPAIQQEFGSSTAEVQWTIGAYLLALASLMAISGPLADHYGRRRMFLAGILVFGVSSMACAAAPSELALIITRLVQGVGAALMQPLALAHATAIVTPERRGWAIGVLASLGTISLMLGPLVGGLMVETIGWRWVFVLNLPIVALALALGLRFMEESRDPQAPPLDLAGVVLLTTGLAALVGGLLHLQEWSAGAAGTLAAGCLALTAFVAVEGRRAHPLLPLSLLRVPAVAGSMVALLTIQGAVLGVTVYVVLFLQNGLGLSAVEAGAVLLPAMVWTPLLATRTGRRADRSGERGLVGAGLVLAAVGLAAIGLLARGEEVLLLMPGLLVFGIARPLVFTPASTGPISAIPAHERGLASSLVTESRQIGAVLGVAVLGSISAGLEGGAGTGASSAGLEAAMLAASGAALLAGLVALALLPRGPVAPSPAS
jgi:EmrB/QacA subfamily drug resistance transporter